MRGPKRSGAAKAGSAPDLPAGKAQGGAASKHTLGPLLRSLRDQRGWTLKEMSERTGIPFSTLSKVERDQLTLTYDKLQQLSQRLNMRMSELFAEPDNSSAQTFTARRSFGTLDAAVQVNTKKYDYFYLCPELSRKRMVPVCIKVRARTLEEFGDLHRHAGEEWIYVVEGRIEVHTEFYSKMCVEAGQSVYLDSTMGHAFLVGEGCEEALIVGACSSAEENLMQVLITAHDAE